MAESDDDDLIGDETWDEQPDASFDFLLDASFLWETGPNKTYRYTRWDNGSGVWCNDGTGWYEVLPKFNLPHPIQRPNRASQRHRDSVLSVQEVALELPLKYSPADFAAMRQRDQTRRQSAWEQGWRRNGCPITVFLRLIPEPLRAVIGEFPSHHWILLEGARQNAAFGDYLTANVPRFGIAFVHLALLLARLFEATPSYRQHFYAQVVQMTPRRVLMWLSGQQITPGALRLLQRLDHVPTYEDDLAALCVMMTVPWRLELLLQQNVVVSDLIGGLVMLPAWLWTPHIVRLLNDPQTDPGALIEIAALATQKVVNEQDQNTLAAYVSRSRTGESLISRLFDELMEEFWSEDTRYRTPDQRAAEPYPLPPFPAVGNLVPITTPAQLLEEAELMCNCVVSYDSQISDGLAYIYRWTGRQRASVLVSRPTERHRWRFDECSGQDDDVLDESTLDEIKAAVERALAARQR